MRFAPEHLSYKALLVVFEAVHACSHGPVKLSLGLRFALAYLCSINRAPDLDTFKRFAACIASPFTEQTEYIGNYMRARDARGFLSAFMAGANIAPTIENEAKLRQAFEKLTNQPPPNPPSQEG